LLVLVLVLVRVRAACTGMGTGTGTGAGSGTGTRYTVQEGRGDVVSWHVGSEEKCKGNSHLTLTLLGQSGQRYQDLGAGRVALHCTSLQLSALQALGSHYLFSQ
jgi:hypothetical protein